MPGGGRGARRGPDRGVGSHDQAGCGGVKGENAKRRRGPRSIPKRRRKRLHFVFRTSPRRFRFSKMAARSRVHDVGNWSPWSGAVPPRRILLCRPEKKSPPKTRPRCGASLAAELLPFRISPRETSILVERRSSDLDKKSETVTFFWHCFYNSSFYLNEIIVTFRFFFLYLIDAINKFLEITSYRISLSMYDSSNFGNKRN